MSKLAYVVLIIVCFGLAERTVDYQFSYIARNFGRNYVATEDYHRHEIKMDGRAASPYRYRVLSAYVLDLFERPGNHEFVAYYFRLAQNFLIFPLAFLYFRRYADVGFCFAGMMLVAIALVSEGTLFQADLQYYTYTQIVLFLLAALLIRNNYVYATIALTALATLNREEALFIPLLMYAHNPKRNFHAASFALLAFSVTFAGISYAIGPSPNYGTNITGLRPGIDLLRYNLTNANAWRNLIGCASFGLLALPFVKFWPKELKRYAVALLPWVGITYIMGSVEESRLFLVPFIVVLFAASLSIPKHLKRGHNYEKKKRNDAKAIRERKTHAATFGL